ncbi:MAG: DUF4197 domain-containing protein [Bacteroidetes bacterium]|nr:DUF4197 domain-containing protein [Bacteroidota bacterium]
MKTFKNILASSFLFLFFSCASTGQIDWNKAANDANKEINQIKSGSKPLSNDEVIQGLREALNVGTNNSTASASKADGFYKNPLIFIPFPSEAQKIKNTVEDLGMHKQVQDFEMSINRAAEEASKEAAPVFLDAIKGMSIADGFSILHGADNAATQYLNDKTSGELTAKFTPIIKNAIQKVEVTKYWNPIITTYNKVPGVEKQNPNLEQYITSKALEGLFKLIAGEEKKIRTDPVARISDILKRVFGNTK